MPQEKAVERKPLKRKIFIEKRRVFLKGRLLSKRKSCWIGKERVLFENSLIDKEESHLVREGQRS